MVEGSDLAIVVLRLYNFEGGLSVSCTVAIVRFLDSLGCTQERWTSLAPASLASSLLLHLLHLLLLLLHLLLLLLHLLLIPPASPSWTDPWSGPAACSMWVPAPFLQFFHHLGKPPAPALLLQNCTAGLETHNLGCYFILLLHFKQCDNAKTIQAQGTNKTDRGTLLRLSTL